MTRASRTLYFAIQRLRRGVTREQIAQAGRLLAAPWPQVQAHVARRLAALHGCAPASAFEWLQGQPLVDRSEIAQAMAAMARRPGTGVEVRHTSGSTGAPFVFVKDTEMSAWMDAAMWAVYAWHGIGPGDRRARFWGRPASPLARLKRGAADRLSNQRRFSAFDLSDVAVRRFFRQMYRFGPTHAYGYPTVMREFVARCRMAGLDGRCLGIRVVISTGELLTPDAREEIGRFFDAAVFNEYGCTESGVLAFECPQHSLHVVPVAVHVEVVDGGGGTAGSGIPGEVVLSDLYGRTAPLLRYRLHDQAVLVDAPCGCGLDLPVLSVQRGRIDAFIETSARGRIYDAILAYAAPAEVQRFRAFQRAIDDLEVHVVPRPEADPSEVAESSRRAWERALAPGVRVTVRIEETLPFSISGKFRYFVPMSDHDG
jgi:phenylacetate-coenzyme A ligase PaaK-like adenylate-forming protein